jgi:hypothetical protein
MKEIIEKYKQMRDTDCWQKRLFYSESPPVINDKIIELGKKEKRKKMIKVGCRIFAYYSQMYYKCQSIRIIRQNGKRWHECRFVPEDENALPFSMPKAAVEDNLKKRIFIQKNEKQK